MHKELQRGAPLYRGHQRESRSCGSTVVRKTVIPPTPNPKQSTRKTWERVWHSFTGEQVAASGAVSHNAIHRDFSLMALLTAVSQWALRPQWFRTTSETLMKLQTIHPKIYVQKNVLTHKNFCTISRGLCPLPQVHVQTHWYKGFVVELTSEEKWCTFCSRTTWILWRFSHTKMMDKQMSLAMLYYVLREHNTKWQRNTKWKQSH